MSTSFNVHLIYGFPVPPDYLERINPETGSRKVYLDEWLESSSARQAAQPASAAAKRVGKVPSTVRVGGVQERPM